MTKEEKKVVFANYNASTTLNAVLDKLGSYQRERAEHEIEFLRKAWEQILNTGLANEYQLMFEWKGEGFINFFVVRMSDDKRIYFYKKEKEPFTWFLVNTLSNVQNWRQRELLKGFVFKNMIKSAKPFVYNLELAFEFVDKMEALNHENKQKFEDEKYEFNKKLKQFKEFEHLSFGNETEHTFYFNNGFVLKASKTDTGISQRLEYRGPQNIDSLIQLIENGK